MTKEQLLGATVICPCHGKMMKVERLVWALRDASTGSTGYVIRLSDGGLARFWLDGPLSTAN